MVGYVVVETPTNYNNTNKDIVTNISIESVANTNREVVVHKGVEGTVLEKGDKVLIHHNILKKKYDVKGVQIESPYHLEGNKYYVPLPEVFMINKGEGWKSLNPYCFVKPIEEVVEGSILKSSKETTHKGNTKNIGVLIHGNESLSSIGVKEGDVISFSRYSEYEFNLEGEILYKMSTKDILSVL